MAILCWRAAFLLAALAALAGAQGTQPRWRQSLLGLPASPSRATRPQDIYNVDRNLRLALPYFSAARPGDYEANRELVRRVAVYLAGLQVLRQDPAMRRAVGQVEHTLGMLPYYPLVPSFADGAPPPPVAPPAEISMESGPRFSLTAPALPAVPAESKSVADSLSARYESAAGRALGAWRNSEQLRLSLASQGAVLNSQTAADVSRLEIYFNSASKEMVAGNWDAALTELQRAEYTTEKVLKVVGR